MAEHDLDLVERRSRVFDGVVEQRGSEHDRILDVRLDQDVGELDRVVDVRRLDVLAPLRAVLFGRECRGAQDGFHVGRHV